MRKNILHPSKMLYILRSDAFFELSIRVVLWWLFGWFDKMEPFIRQIKQDELWSYSYPVSISYVPARYLWMIIIIFPLVVLLWEVLVTQKREDPIAAVMGLSFLYPLNGVLTSILKNVVGRPRPDFFHRCFPNGSGSDFTQCTGDRRIYLDGRKSFPSGHSSFAFACMVFMSLYMARKVKLGDNRGSSWKLCICLMPILVAALIAISRTCDYHHHYEDVIAGTLLGTVLAGATYRLYFPKSLESLEK